MVDYLSDLHPIRWYLPDISETLDEKKTVPNAGGWGLGVFRWEPLVETQTKTSTMCDYSATSGLSPGEMTIT
jgi:hypothetical protein